MISVLLKQSGTAGEAICLHSADGRIASHGHMVVVLTRNGAIETCSLFEHKVIHCIMQGVIGGRLIRFAPRGREELTLENWVL